VGLAALLGSSRRRLRSEAVGDHSATLRHSAGLIAALAICFAQSGCAVQTDDGRNDSDAVRIGALLPYTG